MPNFELARPQLANCQTTDLFVGSPAQKRNSPSSQLVTNLLTCGAKMPNLNSKSFELQDCYARRSGAALGDLSPSQADFRSRVRCFISKEGEPHGLLAALPFRFYLTTNVLLIDKAGWLRIFPRDSMSYLQIIKKRYHRPLNPDEVEKYFHSPFASKSVSNWVASVAEWLHFVPTLLRELFYESNEKASPKSRAN